MKQQNPNRATVRSSFVALLAILKIKTEHEKAAFSSAATAANMLRHP
jgi:hypothetical protein